MMSVVYFSSIAFFVLVSVRGKEHPLVFIRFCNLKVKHVYDVYQKGERIFLRQSEKNTTGRKCHFNCVILNKEHTFN